MSDINPNTPVTETVDTSVSTGEGPLSFDDLETAISKKAVSKKQAKEEKEESPKETKSKEAPDAKEEKDTKSKKAGKEETEKPVEEVKKKTFKAKHQDKELDLDEDATFTVKVNGQDIEVPLKDIVSNYSGKVAWDKKFSELDNDKREFKKGKESLDKNKELIKAIFTEKSPDLRLFKMAELAGVSPIEFRKSYYDENIKLLEQYAQMTDDEKKAADLQFENQYLKYQQETREKSDQSRQAQEALDKKVGELLATHTIDKSEFVHYYDQVAPLADENGDVQFVRQGRQVKEKLTPELIAEFISKDRLYQAAETKFGELKLAMKDDVLKKQMLDLVENAYTHGLKASDIPDVIDDLWGNKKSQRVVKEKVKEKEAFQDPKKPVPPKALESEPLLFDEL